MTSYMWNVPQPRDTWNVPQPRHTIGIEVTGGARIIVRRHGNPEGPRLILSHGNGLAADLYYPFWSLLLGRFDLMLYDLRSHGWNPLARLRHHNIATFAADQERVRRGIEFHFGTKPAIGVFHSISTLAALHHDPPGQGYAALVLLDPPLYPPDGDPYETASMLRRACMLARFRRHRFRTREEFAEHFRRISTYDRVVSGLPELASRTLLRPRAGGYELRCPPALEAHALEYAFAHCVEPDPERLACPVKVIGGDPRLESSFLPSTDVGRRHALGYEFVSGTTHFLPLENPTRCVNRIMAFLEEQGLGGSAAPRRPGEDLLHRVETGLRPFGPVVRGGDHSRHLEEPAENAGATAATLKKRRFAQCSNDSTSGTAISSST